MYTIKNIENYNLSMRKSMIDKIFFLDKINADLIIDVGCADGSLLKFIHNLFPDITLIGYDISEEMIQEANKDSHGIQFTANSEPPQQVAASFKNSGKKVCVFLSSVIHEVYSYGPENVNNFWDYIWEFQADYLVIRDMMLSERSSRPSCKRSSMRVRQIFSQIPKGSDFLRQHESNWGSLEDNWSLIHFLLKYRYRENWEREVHENYLPISLEKFMTLIPSSYDIDYIDHYPLPYIKSEVWKDFYVQLQDNTHLKLILRKVRQAPRSLV